MTTQLRISRSAALWAAASAEQQRAMDYFERVRCGEAAAGRRPALRFCPNGAMLFSPALERSDYAGWQITS